MAVLPSDFVGPPAPGDTFAPSGSTGLISSISGLVGGLAPALGPVGAGLGIASSVGGMFGQGGGGSDVAKAGGDYYSGSFNVNKVDSGSIIGVVAIALLVAFIFRGNK